MMDIQEENKFKQLCKETKTVSNIQSFRNASLFCRTQSLHNNPLIKLKIELLSPEPIIEIYHDYIDGDQIEKLLEISKDYELEKADVLYEDGTHSYDENRLAEEHSFEDDEPFIQILKEKIEFTTGVFNL